MTPRTMSMVFQNAHTFSSENNISVTYYPFSSFSGFSCNSLTGISKPTSLSKEKWPLLPQITVMTTGQSVH